MTTAMKTAAMAVIWLAWINAQALFTRQYTLSGAQTCFIALTFLCFVAIGKFCHKIRQAARLT
jgi:hypothetical protein